MRDIASSVENMCKYVSNKNLISLYHFLKSSLYNLGSAQIQGQSITTVLYPSRNMHLIAFDFDQTIIDLNSDLVVSNLLKDVPDSLKDIRRKNGWTAYMQGVFDLLHEQNVTVETISSVVESLETPPGMLKVIKQLSQNADYDLIIISDANSYFIDVWLTYNNLVHCISAVFTNPAQVVDGKLSIQMYHSQSNCKLSPKNLCKGQVLEEYIANRKKEGANYDKIMYIGDGANDLCPIQRLSEYDTAFVRENYKCQELLKHTAVRAKVVYWKTADDIINVINI